MATAKNNRPASAYAGRAKEGLADLASKTNMSSANTVNMTIGNISRNPNAGATKTSGVKIRGTGAATKGTMARGPLA